MRTKLYLGVGAILAFVIAFSGIFISMLSEQNRSMHEIVKDKYEKVRLANIVLIETNNTGRLLRNSMLSISSAITTEEVSKIQESRLKATTATEDLTKLVSSKEAKDKVVRLNELNLAYNLAANETIALLKAGKKAEAAKVLIEDYRETRIDILVVTEEVKDMKEDEMELILEASSDTFYQDINIVLAIGVLFFILSGGITTWLIRSLTENLTKVTDVLQNVNLNKKDAIPRIDVLTEDEIGEIAIAFNEMAGTLEEYVVQESQHLKRMEEQNWLKTKLAEFANMYQGVQDINLMAGLFIAKITPLVGGIYGVFYGKEGEGVYQYLKKVAAFAYNHQEVGLEGFRLGEGLVGQCALDKRTILVNDLPSNYIKIVSGLGSANPKSIIVLPIEFEGEVVAVIELASLESFSELQLQLLKEVSVSIGVTINRITAHMRVENLLNESQTLTEELQVQSEELNAQQEELKSINEKLEEQNKTSEQKTKELEKIKEVLEDKTRQLMLSSKYKSEFLANVSHELRTPLNSLLILAQMMLENPEGNLTPKQVEYAATIYSSGNDLLNLINDILDLSKVESGKMDILPSEIRILDVLEQIRLQFTPIAEKRGLQFITKLEEGLPASINTDQQRLEQILRNLLSNAFKFTLEGTVALAVKFSAVDSTLHFTVTDTGIGIPRNLQETIFEAFQQGDGTTNRKFGGTGLGLSISREIAKLLGGHITVESLENVGSSFTLILPSAMVRNSNIIIAQTEAATALDFTTSMNQEAHSFFTHNKATFEKEKSKLGIDVMANKKVLLVDDDMRNIYALTSAFEKQQTKVLFAENGIDAIKALEENPDIDLVFMDIMMPEMDGYEAMRLIRQKAEYESLPIIALTAKAMKCDKERCIEAGASDYITKPVQLDQVLSLARVWLQR